MARERQELILSRKNVIKAAYTAYKRTIVPTQWAYHPDDNQVYKFEAFATLINSPSDSKLEPQHCHDALQDIPGLVDALNEQKKATLLLLLNSKRDNSILGNNNGASTFGMNHLDRATSVFQCFSRECKNFKKPIIAWQRAICHLCFRYGYGIAPSVQPNLVFSDCGSNGVSSLATLLGLDAQTAVPLDFDQKAARFVCLVCGLSKHGDIFGRQALTWRECVSI